jgi:hypothetical protein
LDISDNSLGRAKGDSVDPVFSRFQLCSYYISVQFSHKVTASLQAAGQKPARVSFLSDSDKEVLSQAHDLQTLSRVNWCQLKKKEGDVLSKMTELSFSASQVNQFSIQLIARKER